MLSLIVCITSMNASASQCIQGRVGPQKRWLVPHANVSALVAAAGVPAGGALLGVHVRQADPRTELPGLQPSEYPAEDWPQLISSREGNRLAPFLAEVRRRRREDPALQVFVAADTPGVRASMSGGAGVHTLDNRGCVDRSAACLQFAMADLVLLGRAQALLGSALSAFTEVAAALAGTTPGIVGVDF